jgi:hypothetical protein
MYTKNKAGVTSELGSVEYYSMNRARQSEGS